MLRELIPSDLIKLQNVNDWKRSIVAAYNQDAGMSPEDAKITFLKIVYRLVKDLLENCEGLLTTFIFPF